MDNYRPDHRHEKLWLSITNVFDYDFLRYVLRYAEGDI